MSHTYETSLQGYNAYKEFMDYMKAFIVHKGEFNLISLKGYTKYYIPPSCSLDFLYRYALGYSQGMMVSLAQPIKKGTSFMFFQDLDCQGHELNRKRLGMILKTTISILKNRFNLTNVKYTYDGSSTKNRYHVYYYDQDDKKIMVTRDVAICICNEVISKIPTCRNYIDTSYTGLRLPLSYKWLYIKKSDTGEGYWDYSVYMSAKYPRLYVVSELERRLLY
jgi:hypothetical protein